MEHRARPRPMPVETTISTNEPAHNKYVDDDYDYEDEDYGDDEPAAVGAPTPTSASAHGMAQVHAYHENRHHQYHQQQRLHHHHQQQQQQSHHQQLQAMNEEQDEDEEYYEEEEEDRQPAPSRQHQVIAATLSDHPGDQGDEEEGEGDEGADGQEALLDLVQLEELHQEAERMKALGNKHMAAQEFTRAYNAYSAALQLSPVGPSSHVFLSNRAAALLSLKKYTAAATDARRAIALAPTFGKAHARLGQALYFQKDYAGAMEAYQDALQYEPDNNVTQTYLEKAKAKYEKHLRKQRGEEVSVAESTIFTATQSIITSDPNANQVVQSGGYRAQMVSKVAAAAAGKALSQPQPRVPPSTSHHAQHETTVSQISSHIDETKEYEPAPRQREHAENGESPRGAPNAHVRWNNTEAQSHEQQRLEQARQTYLGNSNMMQQEDEGDEEEGNDPEFDEALRIQHRANRFLAHKHYKHAIEEYTAALFLVPDDPNLSPDLHLGRAHALNGSRRHESARNDCKLALRLKPSPAAYSTLAKSLFYMRDYRGAVEAFDHCEALLPRGERLGMFDQAYLEKAQAALEEEAASLRLTGQADERKTSPAPVPKLPPPRFVPREKAMQQAPSIPSMPKQWPQQLPQSPTALKCGPERAVVFFSESLGIKLNRGSDGIVRVLSVSPDTPSSPIARKGAIQGGDVIREAAGVDIRRPITNVMWGDTVALIKMAPRPITLIVAKELSEIPASVREEQRRAMNRQHGARQ